MKKYVRAVKVLKDRNEVESILQSIAGKPLWIHVYVKDYGERKDECWIRIHRAEPWKKVKFFQFHGSNSFARGDYSIPSSYSWSLQFPWDMIQIIEPVTIISEEELHQKYIEDIGYHGEEEDYITRVD